MSNSAPEGNRPSKTSQSSTSPRRQKKSRRRTNPTTKAQKNSRARRRGERRSRIRLRRVLAGSTYFITKKTNDDQFFLRPDGKVDAVLLYVLLEKLNKYGLLLHEFVFMSNHFHFVITDTRGKLPAFMREFLSETGKALKITLETTRRIWSGTRYDATALLDLDAAERFMIYARVNPTEAGLTEPGDWPGLTSAHWKYGDTIEAVRPAEYFNQRRRADRVSCVLEPLPEQIGEAAERSLSISVQEEVGVSANENAAPEKKTSECAKARAKTRAKVRRRCAALQKKIDRRTKEKVAEILKKRRSSPDPTSRSLAGASQVRNASRQKRGNHHYGRLSPRFASKNPERLLAAIESERSFLASHEAARERYLNGEQGVLFPSGTYGYREVLGVRVRKGGAAA